MTPEERELLEKSVNLAEENNKILHSLRRSMRWARFMSILYWVFIIGASVGAYYFIQPYVDQMLSVYGEAKNSVDNMGSLLKSFTN